MDWAVDATGLIILRGTWRAVSPMWEWYILWQIWHWKLLVVGEPDFHTSRLASNSWILELLHCWLARGSPVCSVTCRHFQMRWCDATLVQRSLHMVLVTFVLSTRAPGAMVELSIENLLGNVWVLHMDDMLTPTKLCSLQECLYSTDIADREYSGIWYVILPLDVCYLS